VPASGEATGSAFRDRRRRLVAPGLGDQIIAEFALPEHRPPSYGRGERV
jgi:hypothetical protein